MNLRHAIIALAAIALVVSVVSGGIVFFTMQHAAERQSEQLAVFHTESIRNKIGFLFSEYDRSVRVLADFPTISHLLTSPKDEGNDSANQLLDIFKAATSAGVCYVMNTDGLTIASSNRNSPDSFIGKNYAFRPYFKQAMNGEMAIYMATGVTSRQRGIYFSRAVYAGNSGTPVGVVVVKAPITQLQREIKYSHNDMNGKLCLVAPGGLVFLSDDPELEGRLLWEATDADIQEIARSKQFGAGPWSWSGLKRVSETRVSSPAGSTFWIHSMTVPRVPGWQIVHLSYPSEKNMNMGFPLSGFGPFLVLLACLFLGGMVLFLFHKARIGIEMRTRMEASLTRQSQYMTSLHKISLGLINHLEIDDILSSTLEGAGLIFSTDHAFIYLLEPDHRRMCLRMGIGGILDGLKGNRIQKGEGVTGKVWETGEPLIIGDYLTWPHRNAHPAMDAFNTIIGVPIHSQDRIVGVLGLGLLKPMPMFSEEIVGTLVRFSEMIAIALENSKLYAREKQSLILQKESEEKLRRSLKEIQDREVELRALLLSSRAVLEKETFEKTARIIFDRCKETLQASAGYVVLVDASGRHNQALFLDTGADTCSVDPSLPMPVRGLTAEVYKGCKSVSHNAFDTSDYRDLMPQGHAPIKNVLLSPLVIANKTVGLMGLANKPGGFSERDNQLARVFSEQMAVAYRNQMSLDALEKSETRFRSVIEKNADAIMVVDQGGLICFGQPGSRQIFQPGQGEYGGDSLWLTHHQRRRHRNRSAGCERRHRRG